VDFFRVNGFLPRQQRGDDKEKALYKEMKRCEEKKLFSDDEEKVLRDLYFAAPNYPTPPDRLIQMLVEFVKTNNRLPSRESNDLFESSLASKISHRMARNTFTKEQKEIVDEIWEQYSSRGAETKALSEYEQFVIKNNRLPQRNIKEERKLVDSIQRYLRIGSFNETECLHLLGVRAPYLTLAKQLSEYINYYGGKPETFASEKYEKFVTENHRLPNKDSSDSEEKYLCRIVRKYLELKAYPIDKNKVNKAPKENKNDGDKVNKKNKISKERMLFSTLNDASFFTLNGAVLA